MTILKTIQHNSKQNQYFRLSSVANSNNERQMKKTQTFFSFVSGGLVGLSKALVMAVVHSFQSASSL